MRPTLRFIGGFLMMTLYLSSCSTTPKGTFFQSGRASWYGKTFHGRSTASGEKFNMFDLTAAHKTLPFGTRVVVHSKTTGQTIIVRINDRGPFVSSRVIDLSYAAAKELNMIAAGEVEVELRLQ